MEFSTTILTFLILISPVLGAWPSFPKKNANGTPQKVSATIRVKKGDRTYNNREYYADGAKLGWGGNGVANDNQKAMFILEDGAVLENVILGEPAADGIHCNGSCTLKNVWWRNVGEDAASFEGGKNAVYQVIGGGAHAGEDKVFVHKGGGTVKISNFQVEDFSHLYVSCNPCPGQYAAFDSQPRNLVMDTIRVKGVKKAGIALAAISEKNKGSATFRNIYIEGSNNPKTLVGRICYVFTGVAGTRLAEYKPDGKACLPGNKCNGGNRVKGTAGKYDRYCNFKMSDIRMV